MLLSIPDLTESPADRMYQVAFWYLTSFHLSKKTTDAKKPYNATLGETFECSWDLKSDVFGITTFIGEQVSHHPPVSAFYFENKAKEICLNGHVWTKSKFLGHSMGSLLVGKASLYLLSLKEEYVMNYPNAYARSIFTTPKMELGGETLIECPQTGYKADIVFKTKPMFGGSWHEISCQIKNREGSVISSISGTWNGTLYELDASSGESKEIYTAENAVRIPKRVKPMDLQKPNESRRKWHNVTRALKKRDITTASEMKHAIEEQQRAEARERKEKGQKWIPARFFWDEKSERWIFRQSEAIEQRMVDVNVPPME